MATQSPFSFTFPSALSWAEGFFNKLSTTLQPPSWLAQEAQHRLVLLINHVLQQEPQAQARLVRQTGRTISLQWQMLTMHVRVTPAGLLECIKTQDSQPTSSQQPTGERHQCPSDLALTVTEASPSAILQALVLGSKPDIKIEGDVQLAADINWLADHVSWDVEEDLSRVLGDAPAHAIANMARQASTAVRSFMVAKSVDDSNRKPAT